MRSRMFRGAGLAAMLIAGLAASACSSPPPGSKTAAKLMPQVQALARQAQSVHIAGSATEHSQTVTINLSFSGNSLAGTVGEGGHIFTLLSLNGQTFFKVDAPFLSFAHLPATDCARFCGKYVELPAAATAQLTGSLSLHSFVTVAFSNKNITSAAKSGCVFSPATVHGTSVLQCRQDGATIDVAAHGQPYLLYVTGPHGENLTFSDWNSVVLPTPPPASKVINPSQLGG